MAKIKDFCGLRPRADIAAELAELPYDVVNTKEAREAVAGKKYSYFRVTRSEIELSDDTDPYSKPVYQLGKANLEKFISEGVLIQDKDPLLYLYTQIMNGRSQTGLVACVSIDDYIANRIKKHELTREDKEADRTAHLDILNSNTEPVFLLYKEDGSKNNLFEKAMQIEPEYNFTSADGITHIVRVIRDSGLISGFKNSLTDSDLYIADGHHRAASAVRVGLDRRDKDNNYTGDEEYNSFLAVIFPHAQLKILPYNRTVKDLRGMSKEKFLSALSQKFLVEKTHIKEPAGQREFCMFLSGEWYMLKPEFNISPNPIESLDVNILQNNILDPILGIKDPRKDKRIDFIGGIRGTDELERLVNSGEAAAAFSMYPTTVNQLIEVSDTGGIMPPKSTWFEPKLRSGLVIHLL